MERFIDLNADVGEGVGDDAALIPLVTSVNIACGAHAGDDATMAAAVRAAAASGATIGAHPGHADREGFGRRERPLTASTAEQLVAEQVERLRRIAESHGVRVSYLKLHGALYHQAATDAAIAEGVVAVVKRARLALLCQPTGELRDRAAVVGVPCFAEAFADRSYADDGTLVPRGVSGAVLTEPGRVAEQAVRLASSGRGWDSLCFHGDSPAAVATTTAARRLLEQSGFEPRAFAVGL